MRSMPFKVATVGSVTVDPPSILRGDEVMREPTIVDAWDYLQSLRVVVGFAIDTARFRQETAFSPDDDLSGICFLLQVDCAATGWRDIARVPVTAAESGGAFAEVTVPAGHVAESLTVKTSVVLDRPDEPPGSERRAHLRGSRLFTGEVEWRVQLEGDGGGFPTDAVDFKEIGMPPEAPWHLDIRAADLNMPFMKAVRLQINTSHPAAEALLKGSDPGLQSVLFGDLLLQMLLAVSAAVHEDEERAWEEDSLGNVLEGLCDTYMSSSLPSVCEDLHADPAEFITSLKASTGLFKEYGK